MRRELEQEKNYPLFNTLDTKNISSLSYSRSRSYLREVNSMLVLDGSDHKSYQREVNSMLVLDGSDHKSYQRKANSMLVLDGDIILNT